MTAPSYYDDDPVTEQDGLAPDVSESDTPTPPADEPTPDDQQPTPDPAPTEEPAPAAPPAPDWQQTIAQMAQTVQADYQRRQQEDDARRQAEAQRQAEASRPRPLMEQDEWRQRYEDALEHASYDAGARRTLATMNQELAREEARSLMAQTQQELRLEMQADGLLQQAARESVSGYGGLVRETDFQAVALEVFGGNRAAMAQALSGPQAPQLRQTLADAAAGRALREGRVQPARPAPAPPANPRSAARPAPAQQPVNEITDPNALIAALWD